MVDPMAQTADLSPTIVEALYTEALDLADEVRSAFDFAGRMTLAGQDEDLARVALSCEALRATTRMMHAIAWLLNQRAYLSGELSEFQLRRHGRLAPEKSAPSIEHATMLAPQFVELVDRTKRLFARIERLDRDWRARFEMQPVAVHRLRDRLGVAVAES